ncbi:MAG TPA: cation diffusion facilitator family transporter [Gaiellaceae bacterium]|nr:cation diffusion facilitator family transporter [Gaiellaceae bacterium]
MTSASYGHGLQMQGERRTVLIALVANAVIAVAKVLGGVSVGSAAMLAEGAHSIADTANQGLMLVSLRLGERKADEQHPFGYGKERFFWTFLVAVMIFFAGAIFSLGEGVTRMFESREKAGSFWVSYLILGVAAIAEGVSFVRALRQTRAGAREAGMRLLEFVRWSKEPTTKTVFSEDAAALAGLVLAFGGILLQQLTGSHRWDAGAAILIGLLLVAVAVALGRDVKGLLIGEAARENDRNAIRATVEAHEEVERLVDLRTMYVGPRALLVAARVDLVDGVDGDRIEQMAEEVDAELRRAVPDVSDVYLDPTSRSE